MYPLHTSPSHYDWLYRLGLNISPIWLMLVLLCSNASVHYGQASGDELFDNAYLHEVRLQFEQEDFFEILRFNYQENTITGQYIMASATIDGTVVDSIGVRFKGSTSYPPVSDRKPFKLDFNEFVPGKRFDGLRKVNLNNGFGDPAMQRDALCYHLLRKMGVSAPRTAYARLYLNDEFFGTYILIEQIDKEFIQNNFSNDNGNLFKNMSSSGLDWEGDSKEDYNFTFNLKTNEEEDDWSGFINLIDFINNTTDEEFREGIQEVFDVDVFLRVLAVDVFTGNWDSYVNHGRNFYLYEDVEADIFYWLPWDYNFALGGSFVFDLDPSTDVVDLDIDQTSSFRVLIRRLLEVPEFKQSYYEYFCDLANIVYDEDEINDIVEHNHDLIAASYVDDVHKLYTVEDVELDFADVNVPNSLRNRIFSHFADKQAELDSLTTCREIINISYQDIVINEFMASNDSTSMIADPAGEFDDWIELYNNTSDTIDLTDVFMSDKSDDLKKWQFPSGTRIAPDDYLIVWADDDEGQEGLHSNFKLSKGGEAIYLTNLDDSSIDSVVFDEQMDNIAFARVPNGTGDFVFQTATFASNNDEPVNVQDISRDIHFTLYPNPAQRSIILSYEDAESDYLVEVFSLLGQRVLDLKSELHTDVELTLDHLQRGLYVLRVTDLNHGVQVNTSFIKQE